MNEPKIDPDSVENPVPDNPDQESTAGQGDALDRGTGLGASGGGLGKTTGFWPEKPMTDDLEKAGADVDFDASLEKGRKAEN